jgi:two-component system, cell cycle response regulator DivK
MTTPLVLLVEDNDDNRHIYSTILKHAGYRVEEVTDGESAIETARRLRPALILMDVSIPIIDGWEATERLKRDEQTAMIPVIALTAHALKSDREKAAEIGFDKYISKPALPGDVVKAVQELIGPATASPQP